MPEHRLRDPAWMNVGMGRCRAEGDQETRKLEPGKGQAETETKDEASGWRIRNRAKANLD